MFRCQQSNSKEAWHSCWFTGLEHGPIAETRRTWLNFAVVDTALTSCSVQEHVREHDRTHGSGLFEESQRPARMHSKAPV